MKGTQTWTQNTRTRVQDIGNVHDQKEYIYYVHDL